MVFFILFLQISCRFNLQPRGCYAYRNLRLVLFFFLNVLCCCYIRFRLQLHAALRFFEVLFKPKCRLRIRIVPVWCQFLLDFNSWPGFSMHQAPEIGVNEIVSNAFLESQKHTCSFSIAKSTGQTPKRNINPAR